MTSCYVTNYIPLQDDYNQAYKGHTANEIITQYGAPDRQTDDGAGGRILIYEHIQYRVSPNAPYSIGYFQFYVNKDNVCYGVKTDLVKAERQKSEIPKWQKTTLKVLGGVIIAELLVGLYYSWNW